MQTSVQLLGIDTAYQRDFPKHTQQAYVCNEQIFFNHRFSAQRWQSTSRTVYLEEVEYFQKNPSQRTKPLQNLIF